MKLVLSDVVGLVVTGSNHIVTWIVPESIDDVVIVERSNIVGCKSIISGCKGHCRILISLVEVAHVDNSLLRDIQKALVTSRKCESTN